MKSKIISLLAFFFLWGPVIGVQAATNTVTENGIEVTVTTEDETNAEDISVFVEITNNNPFSITNINIKEVLPEGFQLSEEFVNETITELEKGATYKLDKPFVIKRTKAETAEPQPQPKPTPSPVPETTKPTPSTPAAPPKEQPSETGKQTAKPTTTTKSESKTEENTESEPTTVVTNTTDTTDTAETKEENKTTTKSTNKKNDKDNDEKSEDEEVSITTTEGIMETQVEAAEEEKESNNTPFVIGGIAIVAIGGIIFLFTSGKGRKIFMVFLTVSVPLSSLLVPTQAKAAELTRKSFQVDLPIKIDGTEHTFGFRIEHDSFAFEGAEKDGSIEIYVDQAPTDEVVKVQTEQTTLTGTISSTDPIRFVTARYYSNADEEVKEIAVTGDTKWSITDIPLEIGTNFITIHAVTETGLYQSKEVIINRLSTELQLAENVYPIDPTTDEGYELIATINDTILAYWTDDQATEDPLDDMLLLLVDNTNPILSEIQSGTIEPGDILYIPSNEFFLNGFSFSYQSHDDSENEWGYSPDETEVLKGFVPSFTDLIEGEISIMADSIDLGNPVSYVMAPENSQIQIDEYEFELPSVNDVQPMSRGRSVSNVELAANKDMTSLKLDDFEIEVQKNFDTTLKVEDFVIFDEDGSDETEDDQIKASFNIGLKNLDPVFGVERNGNFGIPNQMIAKMSYNQELSYSEFIEISKGEDEIKEIVKENNKVSGYNFNGKKEMGSFGISGVTFENSIFIGAIGYNLLTSQVTVNSGAFSNPLNVGAVIFLTLDMNGEIKATLTHEYSEVSYVEKGINFQNENFVGSFGTVAQNEGISNANLGDYWFQLYNNAGKSSIDKFSPPVFTETYSLSGEMELSEYVNLGLGVSVFGVMPAAVQASVGPKLNLEGALEVSVNSDQLTPQINGDGKITIGVYAQAIGELALNIKTPFQPDGVGFKAKLGPFEKEIWSQTTSVGNQETKAKLDATVKQADFDRDPDNDALIRDAHVLMEPHAAQDGTRYEGRTDGEGKLVIDDLPVGSYKLTITSSGHQKLIIQEYEFEEEKTEIFYLDPAGELVSLIGFVSKADTDLDASNNEPLADVSVKLEKVHSNIDTSYETQSSAEGKYQFDQLSSGLYEITLQKEGYLDTHGVIRVGEDGSTSQINYMMEAIPVEYGGIGTLSGQIIDSFTGQTAVGEFQLIFRPGYNDEMAPIAAIATTSGANYEVNLPAGIYTVYVVPSPDNANAYQADTFFVKSLGGQVIGIQNGTVTPVLDADQIRIVLTWGESPRDLDSHMTGELYDGTLFQTSFRSKRSHRGDSYYELDVDDTSSFGPETTTISKPIDGLYTFSVFNYSYRTGAPLAESNAMVRVYFGTQQLPFTFYVPNEPGNAWDVFSYDSATGEFTVLNTMYDTTSSYVGPYARNRNARMMMEEPDEKQEITVEE